MDRMLSEMTGRQFNEWIAYSQQRGGRSSRGKRHAPARPPDAGARAPDASGEPPREITADGIELPPRELWEKQ